MYKYQTHKIFTYNLLFIFKKTKKKVHKKILIFKYWYITKKIVFVFHAL